MNNLLRHAAIPLETLAYGPAYSWLKFNIRSPEPLDEQAAWNFITGEIPPAADWVRRSYPPKFLRSALIANKMRQAHAKGIAEHYDVSNAFYELFLDKKFMFYTCADFPTGNETIEEAQTIKADFLLALIDPKPGERILELGCGWGAMLKHIYSTTGDKENLYGFTLSHEQVAHNASVNGFNVEYRDFINTDYPPEYYDKIYSIGAWEHVRPKEVLPLMRKLYGALKPGGRLVQHFFCRVERPIPATAITGQIFFPGSLNAPYVDHVRWNEAAGFRIRQRTIHDYRPTLRAWFDNLVANRDEAIRLVGVETYNRYVLFFPSAYRYFQDGVGMLIRWVMEKPST
ncbi:MAG: class I SAM-dependent methyltransferase [Pirellulaceae bacterium]